MLTPTRPYVWFILVVVLFATIAGGAQPPARAPSATAASPQGGPAPVKKLPEMTNSIGLQLVQIPPGEFLMGSGDNVEVLRKLFPDHDVEDDACDDEVPQHRVRITKPFWLGKYEVTLGQFKKFVADSSYKTEAERDGKGGWGYDPKTGICDGRKPEWTWRNPGFPQTDEHPVVNVSWRDAAEFCMWLSKKEGKSYRLPTEAEWEYACRAGTTTRYYSGNDPQSLRKIARTFDPDKRFAHVQHLKIDKDDPTAFTAPVGKYQPNAFGLYDMLGNAWEWCNDYHDDDYYKYSPIDDPKGAVYSNLRVRRGGAWNSFPVFARASFRNWNNEDSRCLNLGFRVAQDVPDNSPKR